MVDRSKTGYIVHQTFSSLTQSDCSKCVVSLDKRSTSLLAMLLLEHLASKLCVDGMLPFDNPLYVNNIF